MIQPFYKKIEVNDGHENMWSCLLYKIIVMSLKWVRTIHIVIALFFKKNHNIPLISTEA